MINAHNFARNLEQTVNLLYINDRQPDRTGIHILYLSAISARSNRHVVEDIFTVQEEL